MLTSHNTEPANLATPALSNSFEPVGFAKGAGHANQNSEKLIMAHKQMVRRIAWHVHSRMSTAIEVEDLMQIGLIALVESARGFEERGVAFATYANTRIRGAMIDALRRDARMSRSGMANRRRIATARAELEQRLMCTPSDADIAAELGLDGPQYQVMVASTHAVRQTSIDDAYSDHDMCFSDNSDSADESLEKAQLAALLGANLAKLSQREQMVLNLYFIEEMNLEEIGQTLDVGAARICQIKKSALDKLRKLMGN
ncbi:MAG: FliA/WhiG family RNA polymerase sigma factor [Sphingorhabdus sp.]